MRTRSAWLALLSCVALPSCEASQDLAARNCLPLRTPAQLVLLREAGLYSVRDAKTAVLAEHPRNTTNDAFQGLQLLRTVPPGTRILVDGLQQKTGFDIGKGRISAFGALPSGERFEYGWGSGSTLGRAPWEPASVPNLRTVACGK